MAQSSDSLFNTTEIWSLKFSLLSIITPSYLHVFTCLILFPLRVMLKLCALPKFAPRTFRDLRPACFAWTNRSILLNSVEALPLLRDWYLHELQRYHQQTIIFDSMKTRQEGHWFKSRTIVDHARILAEHRSSHEELQIFYHCFHYNVVCHINNF